VKIITRKPIIAGNDELSENHRARSAKLRVVQKI
jgi:16S rRNA (cytosine1402-N4)-methyltransferase